MKLALLNCYETFGERKWHRLHGGWTRQGQGFLDTNVVVSAYLVPTGKPALILSLARQGKVDICLSQERLGFLWSRPMAYSHPRSK